VRDLQGEIWLRLRGGVLEIHRFEGQQCRSPRSSAKKSSMPKRAKDGGINRALP